MPATIQAPGMQEPLDDTMGSMLLGVIVSAVLYGISLVQTLYYYSRYPKDEWYLKYLVTITVVFDTVHLAFITHTVYHYVITSYYNPLALTIMVWSVLLEALFTGVTGALVQCFYTMRIWRLSNKNVALTTIVLLLVFANAGCGTAWVVLSMQFKTFEDLLTISPLTISINALSAAADVIIAVSLCILLRRARTGFKRSDTMINKLILFVVNTGLLTSFCAVSSLISLIISPNSLLYASFYFCIGRLYSNSLLAALNARKSIRGDVDDVSMLVSLPPSVLSPGGTTNSRTTKSPPQNISIRIDTTQEYLRDGKLEGQTTSQPSISYQTNVKHNDQSHPRTRSLDESLSEV